MSHEDLGAGRRQAMRWKVRALRTLYRDKWLHLKLADVDVGEGRMLDHRMIEFPECGSLLAVDGDRVLLMWRHRFITDTWGWEVPGGAMEAGEDPVDAALREFEEETGWRALGAPEHHITVNPLPGLCTARHHVFRVEGVVRVGPPVDAFESDRIAWIPLSKVESLIAAGDIGEGTTLAAMLLLLLRLGVGPVR